MNAHLLCEIHFHEQERASVFLESNCSGTEEKLGEIGLLVGFAMRMMSNLGNSEFAHRLAVTLCVLPQASAELAERDPGDVAVVHYPGYPGRKRFHSDFTLSDKKLRLIVKPKGFGFFARGVGYYAPVAVLVLARYLTKKRREDAEYRKLLVAAGAATGHAQLARQISLTNQAQMIMMILGATCGEYLG